VTLEGGSATVGTRPARAFAASRIPWWAWIVAGDAVLLGLMLFGELLPWSAVAAHVFPFFALQHEMNLATWWSGAQLFMGALIMYERASTGDARERGAWTVLAVVSAGLSFDEIGSIHERLGHRSWQPLFLVAVPLVVVLAWALWRLVRVPGRRLAVLLIVLAYGLFAVVAGLEYLESVVHRIAPRGLGLELEEGLELVGFLLLLFAAIGRRPVGASGLRAVIPDPARLAYLPSLLTAGLVAYPVLAVAIVPRFTDLYMRGNPAGWYPERRVRAPRVPGGDGAGEGRPIPPARLGGPGRALPPGVHRRGVPALQARAQHPPDPAALDVQRRLRTLHRPGPSRAPARPRALGRHRPRFGGVLAVLAIFLLVRFAKPDQWLDDITPGLVAYLFTLVFMAPNLSTGPTSTK
jgi:hypothetical protein